MQSSLLSRVLAAQGSPAAALAALQAALTPEQRERLAYLWRAHARPAQLAPPDPEWHTWLVLAGRGWGKTRVGAEWVIEEARAAGEGFRINLTAATAADVRDVMVAGESGILARSPPDFRPTYVENKRLVRWPNGVVAQTFSAEKPRQQRGPQFHRAWADELAAWQYPDTWDQLQFGLRLPDPRGVPARAVVTTTPRPTELIKRLAQDGARPGSGVRVTRGTTYENAANLDAATLRKFRERYEGTELGRQELLALILGEVLGALWRQADLDARRWPGPDEVVVYGADGAPVLPAFGRTVVAVDPPTSEGGEAGIVVAGLLGDAANGTALVVADRSVAGAPGVWAGAAAQAFADFDADVVVAEDNQGGDMVESTLRAARLGLPVKRVRALVGKRARAEPVSMLYRPQLGHDRGRVRHAGVFAVLESQMTTWVPGRPSPDRMDALVWALTELLITEAAPSLDAVAPHQARMPRTRF